MGWISHHLLPRSYCMYSVLHPRRLAPLTCSVTRSTPPFFPPTFPLGRRVGKLHCRWGSGAGARVLEQLTLQVHLHLSCCSAALSGDSRRAMQLCAFRSVVVCPFRYRVGNLAWDDLPHVLQDQPLTPACSRPSVLPRPQHPCELHGYRWAGALVSRDKENQRLISRAFAHNRHLMRLLF